ncbi:hypothetical protein RAS2_18330 [Phycisphaerae bacterium RAS2]|nr:hypothetical protein RAS2_18330 [Phycisphaerae bacterium RAS2]
MQRDLLAEGRVHLEEVASDTAQLSRVRVYEDRGDMVVYGKIGRRVGVKGRVEAMARVILHLPNGESLEETARAFPPRLPIRRSRKSNFSVRFHGLPPEGSVVRIECMPRPSDTATQTSAPLVLSASLEK